MPPHSPSDMADRKPHPCDEAAWMGHPVLLIPSRAERIIARCRAIAAFTEVAGQTTRTFLAPSMHGVHDLLREWMEAAGMTVAIDAIGNLRAVYPACSSHSKRILIASHLDTVPNAGAFDGILGVVLALSLIEELQSDPISVEIEIVGFSEEEGVRFAMPFLGSLAFIGELAPEALERRDANGVSIEQAIRNFGLDPERIADAQFNDRAIAYLEVHIEQGPVLESEALALGIVTAIVGQTRMQLTFTGQSNHAGTTPMHLRRDAMAAAAAWITAVESYARSTPGLVATVGKVEVRPGAGNVIAGEVVASLDLRHPDDAIRNAAVVELTEAANSCGQTRGVQASSRVVMEQSAVATDAALSSMLANAAADAGVAAKQMVSGAGHDAMIVARRLPAAMLFVRSPGGLSHHPDESVMVEDVEAALATALNFVRGLAQQSAATPITREVHA